MKRVLFALLACLICPCIYASSDSVTVVLNTGAISRNKLVSASADTVVVQSRGINYTFTTKSAKAIVTDDGQYLLGKIETQSDYNRKFREQRMEKSGFGQFLASAVSDCRFAFTYSPNKLGSTEYQSFGCNISIGSPICKSAFSWDFGIGFAMNMRKEKGSFETPMSHSVDKATVDTAMTAEMAYFEFPLRVYYAVPVGKVTFSPYVGLSAKLNILSDYSLEYKTDAQNVRIPASKDVTVNPDEYKLFQMGAVAGLEIKVHQFFASVYWRTDLTDYDTLDDVSTRLSGVGFSLGYQF